MPLWKQRLFTRLQNANDGEGNDLGGSATASAIDAMNLEGGAPEQDPPAPDTGEAEKEDIDPTQPNMAARDAFLDTITDDPNAPPKADAAKPDGQAPDKAGAPAEQPKTPEQEEAELLEGVKSDRGRERIQRVFAERKQLETDVNEFKQMVQSTGMSAQEFAQTLEFGRLMTSNDPQKLGVALEMIEQQRTELYARLGKEAPGVDLLKGHDDLRQAVDSMEITRERAVELAKFRKQEAQQRQQQQVQQQTTQETQEFQQSVQAAAAQMDAYLQTRANQVDHPARMKALSDHFRDPAKMQEFVSTFTPQQWGKAVQMMYDGVQVARTPAPNQPRPIRSRPASLGTPSAAGATPMDKMFGHMDALGL